MCGGAPSQVDQVRAAVVQRGAITVAGEALVIGAACNRCAPLGTRHDISSQRSGNMRAAPSNVLMKPLEFGPAQQEDAAQHQLGASLGMLLRVGKGERGAPQPPNTCHFRSSGVRAAFRCRRPDPRWCSPPGWRRAALAAAALIEQHDAIRFGSKKPPIFGSCRRPDRRAGTPRACLSDCRFPRSRARVAAGYARKPELVGLDRLDRNRDLRAGAGDKPGCFGLVSSYPPCFFPAGEHRSQRARRRSGAYAGERPPGRHHGCS